MPRGRAAPKGPFRAEHTCVVTAAPTTRPPGPRRAEQVFGEQPSGDLGLAFLMPELHSDRASQLSSGSLQRPVMAVIGLAESPSCWSAKAGIGSARSAPSTACGSWPHTMWSNSWPMMTTWCIRLVRRSTHTTSRSRSCSQSPDGRSSSPGSLTTTRIGLPRWRSGPPRTAPSVRGGPGSTASSSAPAGLAQVGVGSVMVARHDLTHLRAPWANGKRSSPRPR